jgi:predicted RNase H-like HicB family nuclease
MSEPAAGDRTITLTAILTREDDAWVARCAEIPVTTDGPTVEEAMAALREAVELWLEDEPAPPPAGARPVVTLFDVPAASAA